MHEPLIVIRTGWGPDFGTGHVQRMASLGWYLKSQFGITPVYWMNEAPAFMPDELASCLVAGAPRGTDLIIRDMRDSTEAEIESLKQIAPVLVIDDLGGGRAHADHVLDLLPIPPDSGVTAGPAREDLFIYGYNFLRAIELHARRVFEKTTDVLYYAGAQASAEQVESVLSLLPDADSCAVFSGSRSFLQREGSRKPLGPLDYVPMLLSSKTLISHFGITMYEAHAAGCGIIAINPTEYHSKLCDSAPAKLGLMNLGVGDCLDRADAREKIRGKLGQSSAREVRAWEILDAARENLDSFVKFLRTMVSF